MCIYAREILDFRQYLWSRKTSYTWIGSRTPIRHVANHHCCGYYQKKLSFLGLFLEYHNDSLMFCYVVMYVSIFLFCLYVFVIQLRDDFIGIL